MDKIDSPGIAGYLYVLGSVVSTVAGQLILKWRMNTAGVIPEGLSNQILYFLKLCIDPVILGGFFAGFVAAILWMAAMTKFDISTAYPFMSLAFVFVLIFGAWIFGEPVTLNKILGLAIIITGLIIATR